MPKFEIRPVENQDDDKLELLDLFKQLYLYLDSKNRRFPLVKNGKMYWFDTISKTNGEYSRLVGAFNSNKALIGLANGFIRYLPNYLGGLTVGHITHIFVLDTFSRKQVGSRLLTNLEIWFGSQGAKNIEAQVYDAIATGLNFWKASGYRTLYIDMIKGSDQ